MFSDFDAQPAIASAMTIDTADFIIGFPRPKLTLPERRGCVHVISALKMLVREHCDLVGPSHSIEARTMPILEWQLSGGSP
jgi:hypothetical protein